jgi:hypothetical protein
MEQQLPLFPELEPAVPEPVDLDEVARKIAANASTPEHRKGVHDAYDRRNQLGDFVDPDAAKESGQAPYIPAEHRPWKDNQLTTQEREVGRAALARLRQQRGL